MTPTTKSAAEPTIDTTSAAAPSANFHSSGGLNINPDTGLCTDYLNHFSEAIMALEMLSAVPESLDDFLAWRPCSYTEHFAASNFKNRDAVIAAYHAADPATRQSLDTLVDSMHTMLTATRAVMGVGKSSSALLPIAEHALTSLKPLVARASMVINGRSDNSSKIEAGAVQAAVDALLQR
jgi:hypothetical protein